jgi:copper(I)-binding protein
MLSSRRAQALRGLAVAAVTALVPAVAGCEAGFQAPTQQWHQPTPGASASVSNIAINNVFVLGAAPQSELPAGASAGVFLALANNGASSDRLVSISAPGSARSVQLPRGGISVASEQSVLLQGPVPQVLLHQTTRPLVGGQSIPLVLDFQKAGTVTLHVPVMPRAADYTTYSPVPATSPAIPSPTATGKTPAANVTPAPSASPSPTR